MLRKLLILVVVLISPVVAHADQVTGGFYAFQGRFSSLTEVLQFNGTTFSVNAVASTQFGITLPAMFTCAPCTSGTSVSLSSSAFLVPGDFSPFGSVIVNGITFPVVTGNGLGLVSDMTFSAGNVIVPISSDPTLTLQTTFSLTNGGIHGQGYGVGFNYSGGIATLTLNRVQDDPMGHPQYVFSSLFYGFAPQPTPEPASIVLLISGLLTVPWAVRKRER